MSGYGKKQGGIAATSLFLAKGVLALALFAIMILAARGAWGMYVRFAEASAEASAAKAELKTLRQREAEIAADVESLSSPRGVEAEVRERYGVARPGEGKIEIVQDSPAGELLETQEERGLFSRIFESFFVW